MAGFYGQLNSDERELVRERVANRNPKQAEELKPKTKKLKSTEGNEEFNEELDDLITNLNWSQPEASAPLKPLLNEYRRYVCEQAAICIQQSFRKYLLPVRRSIRPKAPGETLEDRCGEENCSDSWSKARCAECLENDGCDPTEKCGMDCMHRSFGVRACSEESDPNCDGNCSPNCSPICARSHCPAHNCYSSTNSLDGLADYPKDSPGDCCSTLSPHCGHLTEGSFKSKKNELLNCSMDIDMCATKDEHPFESDELKGKRCSPSSASLSCMEKLSAKR